MILNKDRGHEAPFLHNDVILNTPALFDNEAMSIGISVIDEDGVEDTEDNCPGTSNSDQSDADADGLGDACDDCNNMPGDINDDMNHDILDVVIAVNIILDI